MALSVLVTPHTVRATIGDRAFLGGAASVWTVCRRQYVHRRHYQLSAEDWRLNFLSSLTAVLPHEHLTVLTTTWPHITVTCPCSPRTLCHVKSIRYHQWRYMLQLCQNMSTVHVNFQCSTLTQHHKYSAVKTNLYSQWLNIVKDPSLQCMTHSECLMVLCTTVLCDIISHHKPLQQSLWYGWQHPTHCGMVRWVSG